MRMRSGITILILHACGSMPSAAMIACLNAAHADGCMWLDINIAGHKYCGACRVGSGRIANNAFSRAVSDAQGSVPSRLETGRKTQGGMRSDQMTGEGLHFA